jgi:hypothetical protein
MLGRPQEAPAAGLHWAANIIKAAESSNLLEAGEFAPPTWDTPINRQEIAKIMIRATQYVQKEEPATNTASFTAKITDYAGIAESYRSYIAQAYAKGLVSGFPDGSFGGGRQATRAEAVTMVVRLLDPSYRLGEARPAWFEIIGAVNGENIYRYEYEFYLNTYFNEYFNNYYDSLLQYEDIDLLDEESSRELLGNLEEWAWDATVQAALIRQMAAKEYRISWEPNYIETLLAPGTALSIKTNRLYTLLSPFIEEEAKAAAGIDEAKAKDYYLTDPAAWDCRKVAHIIITADQMMGEAWESGRELSYEEADKAAKERAKDIITRLGKGEDFAKLAALYSADGTAQIGGELDLYFNIHGDSISDDAGFDPLFAAGAFLLNKTGDFSKEPVQSSYGYHIIKALDIKTGFEAVKEYIIGFLQKIKSSEAAEYFSKKLQDLQDAARIERKFEFKYFETKD